ncbi:iron transporter [Pseudorhodoferax soli]|uniref:Iron transporter n=1 Tax=Pseudorhodoferax soli TaxID=545864 RepID=A0A368XN72_9BURK|nr:iron transporter [Pseudorhodoferax soli]RCW68626.1 hypothetical protein DES41_107147 [Pseudorhodoferax soli]
MSKAIDARAATGLARYRLAVASRAVAAAAGGYVMAATCAAALSLALPALGGARPDAVLIATMLAFVLHAIAAMWAFGCASAWRAWWGIGALTALSAAAVLWLRGGL